MTQRRTHDSWIGGVIPHHKQLLDVGRLRPRAAAACIVVFALCAAVVTLTSRKWFSEDGPREYPAAGRLQRMAVVLAVAFYLEIVFGAQLRHQLSGVADTDAWAGWFELWGSWQVVQSFLTKGAWVLPA